MAFTYNADQISYEDDASAEQKRNAVRFLTQDRMEANAMFQDSEIDTWIPQWPNVWTAAAELADMVIGGGLTERQVGSSRYQYLRKMAPTWRAKGKSHQVPRLSQRGEGYFTTEGGGIQV